MMIIMRYGKEHRHRVRTRIVQAAARKLRREGLNKPSVPQLMREAGLTHGGFYGYFRGRNELVAEAIRSAGAQTAKGLFGARPDLKSVLRDYLSARHLRRPEDGCVVAALGSEGGRENAAVRSAFTEVAEGLMRLVHEKSAPDRQSAVSDRTLAITSQMVGALLLARLVDDRLAGRILRASRDAALKT